MTPERLRLCDFTGGQPFHAALIPVSGTAPTALGQPHTHDFAEMVFIRSGRALHLINGDSIPVEEGDVLMVRPSDVHRFARQGDQGFEFINVAFDADDWSSFCVLANLPAEYWSSPDVPVVAHRVGAEVARGFEVALERFARGAARTHLVEFWAVVAGGLVVDAPSGRAVMPDWLVSACAAMADETNLRLGLPRLVDLAAVSPSHLSRTLTRHLGITPVQFIAARRQRHAAFLLSCSTDPVGRVASRCGYASLSYFDRCFREAWGCSPREYRSREQRAVLP